MSRDYFISVAMATFNGEKYIKDQISTILSNLQEADELVISDDGSSDKTLEIVRSFGDPRIRVYEGPKNGVKQNFGNAISKCGGKYIFLCDQDDLWMEGKVDKVLEAFEKEETYVVIHDCEFIDAKGTVTIPSFFEFKNSGAGVLKNFWKNTYIGCCMAFDASMKDEILPVPNNIEMHDQWIGILGDLRKKSFFLPELLIKYRRHDSNESDIFHHHRLWKMITNRVNLFFRLVGRKVKRMFK